jgi:hypothetical protein
MVVVQRDGPQVTSLRAELIPRPLSVTIKAATPPCIIHRGDPSVPESFLPARKSFQIVSLECDCESMRAAPSKTLPAAINRIGFR